MLVVASSLSRQSGPFHLKASAKSCEQARPLKLADDGSVKPRRSTLPTLPPIPPPAAILPPPTERTFHLLVRDGDAASASNYLPVTGVLRAMGDRIQVYVGSEDLNLVSERLLEDVVTTFDQHVFPTAAKTMGQARDVDRDGRFTVLISGWLNRLSSGRHSVDGFVRGADFDPGILSPFSNSCDMMYLNASLTPGPHLKTVLAHEYIHAVTYTCKTFTGPAGERIGQDEEGWLDEALAHLGEDLHGFSRSNLDYRISAFLSHPERYRLVVDDYFTADLFRSHGNRGGTYLFLRWCVDRFGEGLLPKLVHARVRGVENLETATGSTFASLYRAWSVALFLKGLDPKFDRDSGYRTLNMRSPLEGWQLAGPRPSSLVVNGDEQNWESAGTSSHYLVIASTSTPVRVEVQGPIEADLQVSVVPLPTTLPNLGLHVRLIPGPDGTTLLRASVAESRGTPVQLTALAWEPSVPAPNPHAPGLRHGGLDRSSLVTAFGTTALPARGVLQSRPVPIEGYDLSEGPLMIKLLGVDAQGRHVAAWAELDRRQAPQGIATTPSRLSR